jgi:hypothetical protein
VEEKGDREMIKHSQETYVQNNVGLEFLAFVIVIFVAWLANGCKPLWSAGNLAEDIEDF